MELMIVFLIFVACMAASLAIGVTMLVPLLIGLMLFMLLARRKGFTLSQIFRFSMKSLKDSLIVVRILLLIGCLTGLWRMSGTVAYFVTLGMSLIPPRLFLLAAFLLAAVMSFAIGTSFGVTATAGVILISIARAGGVNPVLAAGAILSGVYVGDRGSPAASSANLVAVLSRTDIRDNVRQMLKSSWIPFGACCLIYALTSLFSPMETMNKAHLALLESEFELEWYCLVPAVLMIALPFLRVKIKWAMAVSLVSSVVVSLLLQGESVPSCLSAMIFGYKSKDPALDSMISGGGIVSMLEVCGILLVSGTYGGLFQETGLLAPVNQTLSSLSLRIGRFPVMIALGAGVCALFCNQTIGVIMQNQLSEPLYGDSPEERTRKMLDMENSVILLAGLIPWCIASSVPLSMLEAGVSSLPFAFYLWFVPLWAWFRSAKSKVR